jgi:Spy/CpxP family protein refolding chaperone
MKTRWMAWMASGLMVTMPVLPSIAQTDSNSLTQLFPALIGVQLTPEQQSQLETLSNQVLSQVQRVLTPEQDAQFNSALSQGQGIRVAAQSLNLSMKQRLQLRHLLQPLQAQLGTILTPTQQQQVQQNAQTLQKQRR